MAATQYIQANLLEFKGDLSDFKHDTVVYLLGFSLTTTSRPRFTENGLGEKWNICKWQFFGTVVDARAEV